MSRYRVDEIIVVNLVTDVQNYLDALPSGDRLISAMFDPVENKATLIVEAQGLVVNDYNSPSIDLAATEASIN